MAVAAPAYVTDQTPTVPTSLQTLFESIHAAVPDAYLVGGAVRDLLTGRTPKDIDVVTRTDAREAAEAIASALDGHAFPLDEARGQYRVVLSDRTAEEVDVSHIDDLADDLARRDFTINALAAQIRAGGSLGAVIDPCGGADDLDAGLVRMIRAENLADDPLRLLRAVRLATELQYEVDPATANAIRTLAPRLAETAGERQRDELVRVFSTPRAAQGIRLADALGLLDVLLPELSPARGVEQPAQHHYYDVFEHSIHALSALDQMLHDTVTAEERPWLGPDFRSIMSGFDLESYLRTRTGGISRLVLLKLAGLLHDVSKPETKGVEPDGRIRFLGHPEQGAVKALHICERLRLGNRETRFVATLVEEHLRPTMLAQRGEPPSRRALYRFMRDLGDAAPACLILSLADAAAATGPRLQQERWRGHVAYSRYVLYEASRIDSPEQGARKRLVNGDDLMSELGLMPGPALGEVLSQLDEAQAVGEIETRAEAIEYARVLAPPPTPTPPAERGTTGDRSLSDTSAAWRTSPELWDLLKPLAREHRHAATPAEAALWTRLRRNQLDGLQFRRQHVIDRFIVDFFCSSAKLVIEVDGSIHKLIPEQDAIRQQFLESLGLKVLRFTNEQVLHQIDVVVDSIRSTVNAAHPGTPSPQAGRGQGEGLVAHD
jgi:tRNA nucleotidyltransferase/poly(A) polymerase/very-short-patch-repair endonuclease